MKVKSIAECSHWSILQYFWAALIDNRSWKPIFGVSVIVSGRLRQVSLDILEQSKRWSPSSQED